MRVFNYNTFDLILVLIDILMNSVLQLKMSGFFLTLLLLSLFKGYIAADPDCIDLDKVYLISNPANCSEYFECVRGNKIIIACPSGLVWNSDDKICDYEQFANCKVSTVFRTSVRATPSVICPPYPTKMPYPYDCSKYYHCVNEVASIEDCPDDLYFDPSTEKCLDKDKVVCKVSTTPATTTTPAATTKPATTTKPVTTTTPAATTKPATTSTDNPSTNDPICPATGTAKVFYPYDCNKYYQCVNGQKYIQSCPENLNFNSQTSSCDYIDLVDCSAISPTSTPSSSRPSTVSPTAIPSTSAKPITTDNPTTKDPLCPATGTSKIFYPYDCKKYYQCVNGQKSLQSCPENLSFNSQTSTCDYMDRVDCSAIITTTSPSTSRSTSLPTTVGPRTTSSNPTTRDPICPSDTQTANIFYPYDCSKFYRCVNGQKTIVTCPESMYFNPKTALCDYRDNVDCNITTTTTVSTPQPSTITTRRTTTTPAATTTAAPGPDTVCIGLPDGSYVADLANCRKFYECANQKGTSISCPAGTIWEQSVLSCINSDKDC